MTRTRTQYEMLSTAQVASRTRLDSSTVRKWCRRGKFTGAKWTAAGWRIPPASVKSFNAWYKKFVG